MSAEPELEREPQEENENLLKPASPRVPTSRGAEPELARNCVPKSQVVICNLPPACPRVSGYISWAGASPLQIHPDSQPPTRALVPSSFKSSDFRRGDCLLGDSSSRSQFLTGCFAEEEDGTKPGGAPVTQNEQQGKQLSSWRRQGCFAFI